MPDPKRPLSEGKIAALKLLKHALADAEDVGDDPRQFATSKHELSAAGASESDLLWLIRCRFVDHVQDITRDGEPRRQFRVVSAPLVSGNSCFVLSHLGRVYIERNGFDHALKASKLVARNDAVQSPAERIRWDRHRHELWVDGKLAKRFRHVARAQWAVLDQFESSRWESPVETDPPGSAERDGAQRLRELVAELNKLLDRSLISFRKDCVGQRITFDLN